MTLSRLYLVISGIGLGTIGLTYGVCPSTVLPPLMDVSVEGTDQLNVYRGVMGLYLGMSLFWLLAAFRPEWARPAIVSVVFLMGGLALGRALSVVVDGVPSPALVAYLLVEVVIALLGLFVLKRDDRTLPQDLEGGR
jgi:hypothetical protein